MRTLILALVATTALAVAPGAFAQMMTSTTGPSGTGGTTVPRADHGGSYGLNPHGDAAQNRYDLAVMMLKKKVDRVTREDGGKLTPEHLSSLQTELDGLNLGFGRNPTIRQRASFGHHEAAPGPSSSSSAGSN